jgi:hypothetical protein
LYNFITKPDYITVTTIKLQRDHWPLFRCNGYYNLNLVASVKVKLWQAVNQMYVPHLKVHSSIISYLYSIVTAANRYVMITWYNQPRKRESGKKSPDSEFWIPDSEYWISDFELLILDKNDPSHLSYNLTFYLNMLQL